ncbi:MAG: N-6 DNA methylase [Azonexus sp.]|nr:N-6 DNA methylase [Azonexus sp.]
MSQLQLKIESSNSSDYFDAFRKLYYHLYSNSNASRAERIIGDLSKLLLVSLCKGKDSAHGQKVDDYLSGAGSANTLLLPILKTNYSGVFGPDDKFHLDDTSLRYGLSAIAHLDLHEAKSHLLGDAFQALIGPNLRGDKGQFFTPRSIVRCMIAVLSPKAGSKVVDPACGTAGFLTETASYWESKCRKQGKLIGMDKDSDLFVFASALVELAAPNSSILNKNSLDIKALRELDESISPFNADYVLTNPPFGAKIPIKEKYILSQFDLGHNWEFSKSDNRWIKTEQVSPSQDPQILFVELCVKLLKPDGMLGIVLPEGVFGNSSAGFVMDYLRDNGEIIGLIDCPRTSFQPGTDTKTNILFYKKTPCPNNSCVKIAVALTCGHDRRGRIKKNDGTPFPDDFSAIAEDWSARGHEYWFESEISNKYYMVPRYYDRKTDLLMERDAERLSATVMSFQEMIDRGWISVRKGHEVGSEAYGTGEIPFVRTSDISNFEVSIDPTKSVSEEVFNAVRDEQNLKPGTILMVVDGRYRIGRCAILHEFNFKCIAQSHLRIITVNKGSPISSFELLYLLSLASVQRDIRSLVFIQSTLGSLGSRIKEIKIPVPQKQDTEFSAMVSSFTEALTERAKLLSILSRFEEESVEL